MVSGAAFAAPLLYQLQDSGMSVELRIYPLIMYVAVLPDSMSHMYCTWDVFVEHHIQLELDYRAICLSCVC